MIPPVMCGRYTLKKPKAELDFDFIGSAPATDVTWEPRYNIAPTQNCLVIAKELPNGKATVTQMRWGLIPSWSKQGDKGTPITNARAETMDEKPSFRAAYERRRCLVPADGFFEWKRRGKTADPYYFQMENEAIFFMAGLWESWQSHFNGEEIHSFTILTIQANDLLAKYHHRMPVILDGQNQVDWLEGSERFHDPIERFHIIKPYSSERMQSRAVSHYVNNNRNEGPACLEAPDTPPCEQLNWEF